MSRLLRLPGLFSGLLNPGILHSNLRSFDISPLNRCSLMVSLTRDFSSSSSSSSATASYSVFDKNDFEIQDKRLPGFPLLQIQRRYSGERAADGNNHPEGISNEVFAATAAPILISSNSVVTDSILDNKRNKKEENPGNKENWKDILKDSKPEKSISMQFATSKDDFFDGATKWKEVNEKSWFNFPFIYAELSKAKLTTLVVLTAMGGYAMAPGVVDVPTLLWTTVGTTLCSASANSINQWIEVPYDAQMSRTKNRVLVRRAIEPSHAYLFGIGSGILGVSLLISQVNMLTGLLGLSNIFLYTLIYTPLKRLSIANTWAGAIVGAIPPLMGWTACMGTIDIRAGILAGILYAWQFPHFNSLSWNLRADYSKAGYRMAAVTAPDLNARVSLRYSLLLFPLCLAMPYYDLTTWWFGLEASVANLFLIFRSWKFYKDSNQGTARELFFTCLIYLPAILILMILHKKRRSDKTLEQEVMPLDT